MHRTRGAARWRIGVGALIAGLAIGPGPGNDALAQALPFPSRPIRIIVPYPPGGLGDIFPRGLAAAIAEPLGQQIVIENRPGGTQIIGALLRRAREARNSDAACALWHALTVRTADAHPDQDEFQSLCRRVSHQVRQHYPTDMAVKMLLRPLDLPVPLARLAHKPLSLIGERLLLH